MTLVGNQLRFGDRTGIQVDDSRPQKRMRLQKVEEDIPQAMMSNVESTARNTPPIRTANTSEVGAWLDLNVPTSMLKASYFLVPLGSSEEALNLENRPRGTTDLSQIFQGAHHFMVKDSIFVANDTSSESEADGLLKS